MEINLCFLLIFLLHFLTLFRNCPPTCAVLRGTQHSTPVFLPGKFLGQWSLVGYSPWDHKESDPGEDN